MVLNSKNLSRYFRLAFLASALLIFSPAQRSSGNLLDYPQIQTQASLISVALPATIALQDAQEALDEDSQASQSEADLTSGLPFKYIFYALMASIALFSAFLWKDRTARNKARNAELHASRKKQEIGAITRKLQQRLPENRIARDRMSSTAPRIRSKPAEAFTASPFSSQRHSSNNPKILIIDDQRDARTAVANQLHRYYSTLESDDLNESIRIARIARPALIILGMQASKQDCIAFCRKLKSDSTLWHIPILLLTTNKGDALQLIKATDDYLSTPLQPAELMVAVENLVDVRSYLKSGGLQRPRINGEDSTTQISDTMFLDAVHTVVENNLSNSLFGLETLGQEVNVSIRQLHGRLRQLTRLSPAGFIRTKRLKQASDLLSLGTYTVQEIARMVGFHSPEYFHRVFKQAFGVAPGEYRRS